MSEKASIVLRGGHVQTMVAPDDIASAVAVCGNRIAYVGDDAGAEAYIGEGTKVIDLDGRFVCPGFMDGHLHVPGKWITTLYQIDLEGKSTNEEYVETIRSFIEAHPDEEVYTGQPFLLNAYMLEDGSNPEGWFPEERITMAEALRAYTYGSAYAMGVEDRFGTLAAGKMADICVLDRNLFTCEPAEVLEMKSVLTMIGGEVVFEA